MDLLFKHKNDDFKRFKSDRASFLQEKDQMFKLHALLVDTLTKVRRSVNREIVGQERKTFHPTKDASFDIFSLANQLHCPKSTWPEGPETGKIYFSENQAPNLLAEGIAALERSVYAFNESLLKD